MWAIRSLNRDTWDASMLVPCFELRKSISFISPSSRVCFGFQLLFLEKLRANQNCVPLDRNKVPPP